MRVYNKHAQRLKIETDGADVAMTVCVCVCGRWRLETIYNNYKATQKHTLLLALSFSSARCLYYDLSKTQRETKHTTEYKFCTERVIWYIVLLFFYQYRLYHPPSVFHHNVWWREHNGDNQVTLSSATGVHSVVVSRGQQQPDEDRQHRAGLQKKYSVS